MATLGLAAALLLAQAAPTIIAEGRQRDAVEVGYVALESGRPAEAIDVIRANPRLSNDPAALINLGTAYARLGDKAVAGRHYLAAVGSTDRYDLELADGTWMDSRRAARLALARLDRGALLAVR